MESHLIPGVAVTIVGHEDDGTWLIKFIIELGPINVQFTSHEPHMLKLSKWQQLIRGEDCKLDMYMGNG